MSVYQSPAIDELVKIDANHANFLRALIACQKPQRLLELGFGAGEATRAILGGLDYNAIGFEYTVVDNWMDFGGVRPTATEAQQYRQINFVSANERDFVLGCQSTYDFIFSDADHHHTQEWFDHAYQRLVAPGGVLIYHDVTNSGDFPNLLRIYQDVVHNQYDHVLFNRSSRPEERCGRGLLVIFKH